MSGFNAWNMILVSKCITTTYSRRMSDVFTDSETTPNPTFIVVVTDVDLTSLSLNDSHDLMWNH